MKKVLSVFLAFVMIFSIASVSAMAADEIESDFTMTVGETKTVQLPGTTEHTDFIIIKFVPVGSGLVAISSDSPEDVESDPVLEVYDDQMNELLAEADDNDSDRDFYLEFDCEAGEVYYLAIYNLKEATTWDVSISCFHERYENGVCVTCLALCNHTIGDNLVGCCPCGLLFFGLNIKDGNSVSMFSNNDYIWFKFEPEETAAYLLTSDNTVGGKITDVSSDPAVIVVDETGNFILASDDDISEDNYNFALPYEFEEGERYFIGVCDNNDEANGWVFTLNKATSHTVEVEETVENEDGTTTTVITTVVHELTYIPEQEATCEMAGHSTALYCETCDEYLAGNRDYGMAEECKDDDEDNHCDWCDRIMVEEEPVECSCDCHATGLTKLFFNIKLFFQKLFRLNSVCTCGERHY